MGGVRGFRLAALVLAGVFLPAMAAADSFESLMGDPYGTDGAPAFTYATPDEVISQDPIFGRVDRLVYPVQGMPALVEPGGEIELRVLSSQPESLRKLWEWRVNLATASEMEGYTEPVGAQAAQRYTLITTNIRYDYNFGGYRVIVQVPEDVPYDTYHLEVDTFRFSDVQPNAVGVRPADGDTFRMVVMSDAQYGDPDVDADAAWVGRRSFEFDDDTVQAEMLERQWADDLPFLSPDLVLSTGNLIYGLGPNSENREVLDLLARSRVNMFSVPGSHDGQANVQSADTWSTDGLEFYAQTIGPLYYSFAYHGMRFLGANSMDGNPYRRSAEKLTVLDLGGLSLEDAIAALVDGDFGGLIDSLFVTRSRVENSGGFIAEVQQDWMDADLAAGDESGLPTVVFMHHDPRGPFTPNEPYGPFSGVVVEDEESAALADAMGLEKATGDFDNDEAWNYESEAYDSRDNDGIADETPTDNTGLDVLRRLVEADVSWVFMGHTHRDSHDVFESGQEITDADGVGTGVIADQQMHFVHTTTLAGETRGEGDYFGYRLIDVVDGEITSVDFAEGLGSVPGGNIDVTAVNNDGTDANASVTVRNWLPRPIRGQIVLNLPRSESGYRIVGNTGEEIPIDRIGVGANDETVLYAWVEIPAGVSLGEFPSDDPTLRTFSAEVLTANSAPTADFEIVDNGDQTYTFVARDLDDPEGDEIARVDWRVSDGQNLAGSEVLWLFSSDLEEEVRLLVTDSHGARRVYQTTAGENLPNILNHKEKDDDDCEGCSMAANGADARPDWFVVAALILAAGLLRRKTR